jgi:hypothetical protein
MSASYSKSTELVAAVPDDAPQCLASGTSETFSALPADAQPIVLTGEPLLTAQAMRLLMRLDGELLEARAQWNQDWFRRIMRIRPKAVVRLRRRWSKLDPTPAIPLGALRRRYHARLGKYLYEPKH